MSGPEHGVSGGTMIECWACATHEEREHMDNLVIRKRIGAIDDLSVVICFDCQMKVRQLLREIREATHGHR